MQIDYIVVGIGLAGVSFCEHLIANNKTFVVFDNASQQSSTVAAGLYNPVVLKRFNAVWKVTEQLDIALPLYTNLEKRLHISIDYKAPIYRKFSSLEEQNNWFLARDKPLVSKHLSSTIQSNTNPVVNAPFGFGEVLKTGRIDVNTLLKAYKKELLQKGLLQEVSFSYNDIITKPQAILYKGIMAKHIVFAEGFGIQKNPFFNHLPLTPVKGELITIHAPDLKTNFIIKSGVFIIPLGNHKYNVGSTYQWKDLNHIATERGREELITKLKKIITCDFKVMNQVAGIRPAVKDRKPLVGVHNKYKNMFVLNGLGSRGVMLGPYVSLALYNLIEHHVPLEKEIDIKRFSN